MIIHSLDVANFRGITHMRVDFDATGITLIDGDNESGKTSFIDAFEFLLGTKTTSTNKNAINNQQIGSTEPVEITAEFTIDGQRMRYGKVFRRSGSRRKDSTTLDYITPAKPGLSGDAAHSHVEQLFGGKPESWLWNKFRVKQDGHTGQLSGVAGISELTRALDAQAGEHAPGDDDSLITAVTGRRDRYFGKAGKPKGDYSALIGRESALRAETEKAVADAADLARHITRLDELGKRLDRKTQLVADAEVARDRARRAAADLADVNAEAQQWTQRRQLLEAHLTNAINAQQQRIGAITKVNEATTAAAELKAQHVALAADVATHKEQLDELAEKHKQAEHAAQRAAATAGRMRQRLELLTVTWDRRKKEHTQRRADALVAEISELHARVDRNDIADDAMRTLREAHSTLRELSAAVHAATSQIVISGSGNATVNGVEIDAAQRWESYVDGPTEISVGDVTVEVNPPADAAAARHSANQADKDYRALLDELGVQSVDDAETRREKMRDVKERIAGLEGQLSALWGDDTPENNQVAIKRLTAREELLREELDAGDIAVVDGYFSAAANSADSDAADTMDAAHIETAIDNERHSAQCADEAHAQAAETAHDAQIAWETAQTAGAQDLWTLQQLSDRHTELTAQAALFAESLAAAREQLSDADVDTAVTDGRAKLDAVERDSAAINDTLARAKLHAEQHDEATAEQSLERHRNERAALRDERTILLTKIDTLSGQGLASTAETKRAELTELQGRLDRETRRAEAARLLYEVMVAKRGEAIARYAEPLREELTAMGKKVFGYDFDVQLNDDLEVNARELDGTWVPYDSLSGGAKEQFGLLTRIVSAKIAAAGAAPIILDDTLGYTDPSRREAMARVITEIGKDNQIIVLTCDEERFQHLGAVTRYTMTTDAPPAPHRDSRNND